MQECFRPCKVAVVVVLSFGPYNEDELAELLQVPKTTLRVNLFRYQQHDHIIEKEETRPPVYRLTPAGEEYLKTLGERRYTPKNILKSEAKISDLAQKGTF